MTSQYFYNPDGKKQQNEKIILLGNTISDESIKKIRELPEVVEAILRGNEVTIICTHTTRSLQRILWEILSYDRSVRIVSHEAIDFPKEKS